jgi:hypothetical protein
LIHYASKARPILERNIAEHRGLQLAINEIDGLLNDALSRAARGEILAPDYRLWLNLAHAGVTPLGIITMFSAALLYEALENDTALSEQNYHHRIARAVMCLDKLKARTAGGCPKELDATGQRQLGRFLLGRFGGLGTSLLTKVRADEEKDRERWAAMAKPLI